VSEALYERYKDALRRGHVAALRGRLDQAAVAYGEAAALAPDRALPHSSLGGVLLRLGRPAEALAAWTAALDRAAGDEASLAGRADALVALGRPAEAAESLEVLADLLDATGRLGDALDTARRAIELAESRPRRRRLESLARRLRDSTPDDAGQAALDRASRALDVAAFGPPGGSGTGPVRAAAIDLGALAAEAEAAIDAGDLALARERLLEVARARAVAGQANAALDACGLALAFAPADPDIHLALVALYLERGWRAAAIEKLALLGRLAELTGDEATTERLRTLVAGRFPGEPRLASLAG